MLLLAGLLPWPPGLRSGCQLGCDHCPDLYCSVYSRFDCDLAWFGWFGSDRGYGCDANILIFERLREEQDRRHGSADGDGQAYSQAFITILDANLTTFITALILFYFGSGPVQGFGGTLMIGILASMFGAIYLGRLLTDFFYRKQEKAKVFHLGVPNPRLSEKRKPAFALSLIVAIVGFGYFLFGKDSFNSNFDIDFTGGNQLQVTFGNEFNVEEVDQKFAQAFESDKEGNDLLNPANIQVLPYLKTRQWCW